MSIKRSAPLLAMLALVNCGLSPRAAQAGPLLDWLFGRSQTSPAYPVGAPVPVGNGYAAGYGAAGYGAGVAGQPAAGGYAPTPNPVAGYAGNYGTYYSSQLPAIGPAGAGYMAPMPSGIAAATMPAAMPPTLSYVPNFQTQAQRTPVTYYRPLLTTDPNTGAQVVAMAPCTSYEMLAQRAPTLGRSALFGSSSAPAFQPPAQALPTYTLPSGGIPLAYASPSISAPYSTAYGVYGTNDGTGGYSMLQPQTGQPQFGNYPGGLTPSSVGPAGAYPTTPLSQSTYYGSTSGGSCGGVGQPTPWQTVPGSLPGLVAPQAPVGAVPSTATPSYPSSPAPYSQPGFAPPTNTAPPAGLYPPNQSGNVDPADMPPVLPSLGTSAAAPTQSNLRPQLRSVVRYPSGNEETQASASRSESTSSDSESRKQLPAMLPIPAPADFNHEPRWNPGLLREEDMTALRPVEPSAAQWAGHAKPIVWASFETPSQATAAARSPQADAPATSSRLRPILTSPTAPQPVSQPLESQPNIQRFPESRPAASNSHTQHIPPSVRRDASGWKASR